MSAPISAGAKRAVIFWSSASVGICVTSCAA